MAKTLPSTWMRYALAGGIAAVMLFTMGSPAMAETTSDPDTAVSSDGARAAGPAESSGLRGISGTTGTGDPDPRTLEPSGDLKDPLGGPDASDVIGDDDRERVDPTTNYPTRAIVQISRVDDNGDRYGCTGWMYGPDTLATAGHCVHPGEGQDGGGDNGFYDPTSFTLTPARNGSEAPYGTCEPTVLYSVTGWTEDGAETHDYAAMKLDCNVGNVAGTWGLWWQDASLDGTDASLSGYPCDKPSGQQWRHTGQSVEHSQDRQIFYRNDTFGCQSGSPVYDRRPDGDDVCAGWCSMAIHAYGRHDNGEHATHNHGTRITEAVFDNMIEWRSA